MLAFQGPAQPSPTLGDALNGGYPYLEVKCLGCETTKRWRSTSFAGRRRRRSMSLSDTCAAKIVHDRAGAHSSVAI
jgi:hypothetical protein